MGFRRDLFFISVWIVDFPAALSLPRQESFAAFCTCRRVSGGEDEMSVSKIKTQEAFSTSAEPSAGATTRTCSVSPDFFMVPRKHLSAFFIFDEFLRKIP